MEEEINNLSLTTKQLEVLKLTVGARMGYLRDRLESGSLDGPMGRFLQWQLDELKVLEPMLDDVLEATL